MTPELEPKVLPRKVFEEIIRGERPLHEIDGYLPGEEYLDVHEKNRRERLTRLTAMRKALKPVWEKYLNPDQQVLEVGCGAGFLKEFLVPEWLKERIVSFDINFPSLKVAQKRAGGENLFQGDVYQLGVANESVDLVLALSSFDSPSRLWHALEETSHCLKIGGKIIFIQDLVPLLYAYPNCPPAQEVYHKQLVSKIENLSCLEIIDGKEGVREAFAVEPIAEVEKRVKFSEAFEDFPPEIRPFFIASDIGSTCFVPRPKFHSLRKLELRHACNVMGIKYPKGLSWNEDEIIEWVRLQVLVTEKIGPSHSSDSQRFG